MANIIVYIIKHLHKLTADVLRSSPKEDNSLVFSMQCLRHRECKLNINNSDRMAGWRAVSRNPMSLHHLAIGRGGASWIALEPVRNKLIQAIFFLEQRFPPFYSITEIKCTGSKHSSIRSAPAQFRSTRFTQYHQRSD